MHDAIQAAARFAADLALRHPERSWWIVRARRFAARESKLSGTAVLSYKPTDRLLTYASYSRGYKAGGFNLDRSALWRAQRSDDRAAAPAAVSAIRRSPAAARSAPATTQASCRGSVASGADLQFKPEINDAFEAGLKYHGRGIDLNFALFHEVFRDFQLNTFNGLNFFVENINSCSTNLNGADTDNNPYTGACTGTPARRRSQPGLRARSIHSAAPRPCMERRRDDGRHQISRQPDRRRRASAEQRPVPIAGPADLKRAAVDSHVVGRLDSADCGAALFAASSISTAAT